MICTCTSWIRPSSDAPLSTRVVLDDLQLVDGDDDVLASRAVQEPALERLGVELQPRAELPAAALLDVGADHRVLLRPRGDLDLVAGAEAVGRDVHALAVDEDVAVGDELARLTAGVSDPQAVDDVVQPRLQELQEDRAGRALGLGGLLEEVVELLLAHVVVDAQLLLLAQAHPVVARLAATALAVLAGRVGVGLHVALNLRRLDEVHAFAAAELDYRSSVATHVSPSAPYGRLRLRGRQPLCGDGVSSMIVRTFTPVAWIDLIACSRPEPVPRITMSTCEMPMFWAFRVASAAASCAAYGVPFFEPL